MGMFFSTIHIQNKKQLERKQFIEIFSKYIKKQGFMPADEENSQYVYYLAFSDNREWVTLSSPEFEVGSDSDITAQKISKALKSICIETSVNDSDWAIIKLYDSLNKTKDTVIVGDVEEFLGEESVNSKGKQECWTPLLVEGRSWEELQEIWQADYTFAEDVLSETAQFLGMDVNNIRADDNSNVVALHFKATGEVFIKEGATKLAFDCLDCPISMEKAMFSFYNIGGISKGLAIILLGDCFKNHEIEVSDVTIRRNKYPKKAQQYTKAISMNQELEGANEEERFHARFQKYKATNNRYGVIAIFEDYEFFEGLNIEHPSMEGTKVLGIRHFYSTRIYFTAAILSGQSQQFYLHVIPMNNWENQIIEKVKVHINRDVREQEDNEQKEKYQKSFKYLKNEVDSIRNLPEKLKKGKQYIMWLEEVASKTSEEWKNTQEYAQLLEELKKRKEQM